MGHCHYVMSEKRSKQTAGQSQRGRSVFKLVQKWWRCAAPHVRYGLDGPVIESQWGRDFPHPSRPAQGPPSRLYKGYWVSLPGTKLPECGFNHPHHLEPRLKKE